MQKIGHIKFDSSRQRWALRHVNGSLSNWFARGDTRDSVVATLAGYGITVDDSGDCFRA